MISLKTPAEIQIMRQGGRILSQIMKELKSKVEPDLTTAALDKLAQELILKFGAQPAFKNYRGFPAVLCTSINEQIVHAVPSDRLLKSGDILSLDLGIIYQGFCLDLAVTVPVGSVPAEAQRLIRITKKALKRAIGRVKPGKHLGDISQAIESYVEGQGFKVVRDLCGHGIGRHLHEEPEIPNFGQRHQGPVLKEGMVLALEPMAVMGRPKIKKGPDRSCYQTADNSLAAHFEHTVAVVKNGVLVLTD